MIRDTDCRSYKKIIKKYRNNASILDTKTGVGLLFIYLTYFFLYIESYYLLSGLMPMPTGFITYLFIILRVCLCLGLLTITRIVTGRLS